MTERRLELRRDLRTSVILGGTTLGVGAACGFALHASMLQFLLALFVFSIGAALIVVALMFLLVKAVSRSPRPGSESAKFVLLHSGLACVAAFVSLPVGVYRQKQLLQTAKSWSERQIPLIEAYRTVHARYPSSLPAVVDPASIPWAARTLGIEFHAVDERFDLVLWTGPLSGWYWSSESGEWARFD